MTDTPISAEAYAQAVTEVYDQKGFVNPDDKSWIEQRACKLTAARASEGAQSCARAVISGDSIVIRLPIDSLRTAVHACPDLEYFDDEANEFRPPVVTDSVEFARAVVHELNAESEDGTTRIHRMFDGAFVEAIEQGAEGIVLHDDDEYAALAADQSKEQQT